MFNQSWPWTVVTNKYCAVNFQFNYEQIMSRGTVIILIICLDRSRRPIFIIPHVPNNDNRNIAILSGTELPHTSDDVQADWECTKMENNTRHIMHVT